MQNTVIDLNTVIVEFSNLFKMNRNKCYSFSCDFPMRYVNGCPESKTLHLKYQIWGKTNYNSAKVLQPMIVKCLNEKKTLQRIIIRFSNFGPNWDNIGGFSLMGQGIGKSPAIPKNLLILFSITKKNLPINRLSHQIFIPLH